MTQASPNRPIDGTLGRIARSRLKGMLLRGAGPGEPSDVVAHLTAVQSQDHSYALWSLAQRMPQADAPSLAASFDRGEFLRTHVLRPTWHYVAASDIQWLVRLSGPRVDRAIQPKYRELELDDTIRGRGRDVIVAALADGPRTRSELATALERNGLNIEGERATFMLMNAELAGLVCSGPMRGRQHTYALLADRSARERGPDGDEALGLLARRYFTTRGLATVGDFAWWSGLSFQEARSGLDLAATELERVEIDGTTYWRSVIAGEPSRRTGRLDLVQCYDEIVLSYRAPRLALHGLVQSASALTGAQGFQQVILLDGQLLGHWRARRNGRTTVVETRLAPGVAMAVPAGTLAAVVERYRRFADG